MMYWLFIEKFALTTHYHHTEIMRVLYDVIKNKGVENVKIEGITSHKKFEIRKSSSWWSRNENAWAEGLVEETPEGSVIRVRMIMDMAKFIFVTFVNLVITTMLLVGVLSGPFDLELLFVLVGGLLFMFLLNGIFRLIFLSEVKATKGILIELLKAKESEQKA